MIGIVISDTFLVCGVCTENEGKRTLNNLKQVPYTEPINNLLYLEGELNSILGIALRRATEYIPVSGQDVVVAIDDDFVHHSVLDTEVDLAREDYWDYINWIEQKKNRPESQEISLFGQIYLPEETNIHIVACPIPLTRTIKLSIAELGGNPYWMGPASSVIIDAGHVSDAAMIKKKKNQYEFHLVQNCRYDHGLLSFTAGIPRIINATQPDDVILSSFRLIESDLDDVPVYSPGKLGRQAIAAWESSDLRLMEPFDSVSLGSALLSDEVVSHFELNILSELIISGATGHSFNFFEEPQVTDFLFTELFSDEKEPYLEPVQVLKENRSEKVSRPMSSGEMLWLFLALIFIMGLFFAMNYIKFREDINRPIFGTKSEYTVKRSAPRNIISIVDEKSEHDMKMHLHSRAVTSILAKLFLETDLERYNNLTVTKSFISLEYMSGLNPDIEHTLELEPTSYSVEATGDDSTMFLWYYSFDFPTLEKIDTLDVGLDKDQFLVQLDTIIADYTLKYFDQIYRTNRIYEPVLVWVRNKDDIIKAGSLLSKVGSHVLLRKFVLFNEVDRPEPRAGFYISFIAN